MEFTLPELGEGVYEAEFVGWLVRPGDTVKQGQPLMEVLTDKATMEVPAPFVGRLTELKFQPGQKVKVGEVALTYTPAESQSETPLPSPPSPTPATATRPATLGQPQRVNDVAARVSVRAAPSVRHLARKLGVDLNAVQGSGPDGRILLEDLTARLPTGAATPSAPPRPDYGTPGTRLKLIGLRRRIAERMVHSKHTIPHYTYVDECDVTELVRLRDQLKDRFARKGAKLTYLAFFVKAAAAALKEVPIVNASLDEAGQEIVLHDGYHIGVAVATPAGLVVPVVRDADRKGLAQIAADIERLGQESRQGKSRREDLSGGTFTITSVGGIGGLISTPVINHPEVAILGLGKVVRRPVYDAQGAIRPADLIYLSLSFDHRVVDGAVGAAFANVLIRTLQTPAALLLED